MRKRPREEEESEYVQDANTATDIVVSHDIDTHLSVVCNSRTPKQTQQPNQTQNVDRITNRKRSELLLLQRFGLMSDKNGGGDSEVSTAPAIQFHNDRSNCKDKDSDSSSFVSQNVQGKELGDDNINIDYCDEDKDEGLPGKTHFEESVPSNNVDYSSPIEFPICFDDYEDEEEDEEDDVNNSISKQFEAIEKPDISVAVHSTTLLSNKKADCYSEEFEDKKELVGKSITPCVSKFESHVAPHPNTRYTVTQSSKKKKERKKKRKSTPEEKALRNKEKRRRKESKKNNGKGQVEREAIDFVNESESEKGDKLETPRKLDFKNFSPVKAPTKVSEVKNSSDPSERRFDSPISARRILNKKCDEVFHSSVLKAKDSDPNVSNDPFSISPDEIRQTITCLDPIVTTKQPQRQQEQEVEVELHTKNLHSYASDSPLSIFPDEILKTITCPDATEQEELQQKEAQHTKIFHSYAPDDPFSVSPDEILQTITCPDPTDQEQLQQKELQHTNNLHSYAFDDAFSVSPDDVLKAKTSPEPTSRVQQDKKTEDESPICLLCSEAFIENFGQIISDIIRGDSIVESNIESSTTARRPIRFIDSDLVDVCSVDIETPSRGAMVVSTISQIRNSGGIMTFFLPRIVALAATNRYDRLVVFVCVDVILDSAITRDLVRLQSAFLSCERELPRTQTSIQLCSKQSLGACISRTIYRTNGLFSDSLSQVDYWLSDSRACQRLKFLLSIIPTLSATGALHWLHLSVGKSSWSPLRNNNQYTVEEEDQTLEWFQQCFQDVSAECRRLESHLLRSKNERYISNTNLDDFMNPDVPKQLVLVIDAGLKKV